MKKIVLTQPMDLFPDQKERLNKLGRVIVYDDFPANSEEWLERCQGADVICSRKFGLEDKVYELFNVFISLPFVGVGFLDKRRLVEKKISVAYCPGCNKDAVTEWLVGMTINFFHELPKYINIKSLPNNVFPERSLGLRYRKITILGAGNIGKKFGEVCRVLGMEVTFFRKGEDLLKSAASADLIANCLSYNPTTENLLDSTFFDSLKKGSYYLSITSDKIHDIDALIGSLNKGILSGAALDFGDIKVGNYSDHLYQKLIKHPKILATPHIAYNTDVTSRVSYDMMIDNIEAWLNGTPKNLLLPDVKIQEFINIFDTIKKVEVTTITNKQAEMA